MPYFCNGCLPASIAVAVRMRSRGDGSPEELAELTRQP